MQDRHGPLPALLLILTVVTGLVDAVILVDAAAAVSYGHQQLDGLTSYTIIVLLAFSLGLQNATVRP
jgi:hypothetical protein